MIAIRNCSGFDDLEACVRLQIETWGYDESDVVPRKAFRVAQKIGGQVMGAFDLEIPGTPPGGGAESMVAFLFSLPGVKTVDGQPCAYLHSHMLAVRASYRNQGLGARLKLEQRRDALARGIRHIEWTFDPLEIKNAFLNIHKLGAIARAYEVDFYGASSSRLQGGLPTDRLLAEWQLDSPRVNALLQGNQPTLPRIEEHIFVPASVYTWKTNGQDRARAQAVQLENRCKFQEAFARGLAVLGFVRDSEENGIFELGVPAAADLESSLESFSSKSENL